MWVEYGPLLPLNKGKALKEKPAGTGLGGIEGASSR